MTSDLTIYPSPIETPCSTDYKLRINGRDVFVHQCDNSSFAIVSARGMISIEIESLHDFSQTVVRPLKSGITPAVSGRTIGFEMNGPAQLSVELDNRLKSPLFLFVMPPETEIPSKDDPSVRYFEAGKVHEPGIITLATGQTLYIEGGAVVHGRIDCEDASGVRIMGRGVLDGFKYQNVWKPEGRRPCQVRLSGCNDVTMEGVTLVNSPSWVVVPNGCKDIHIRDINIITCVSTGDGIDVVGSSDVIIEKCFIRADDDCVALKSVNYFSEKGINNVERVRVSKCVLWNGKPGDALEIGYETRCDYIRDVVFSDCDIIHMEHEGWQSGAAFSIHNSDRAVVSDIRYENIRVEDCQEKLFDLKVLNTNYSKDAQRGQIIDITFKDISVVDGTFPVSVMRGHAEWKNNKLIENVTFENLVILGKRINSANEAHMVMELSKDVRFVP